MDLKTAAVIMLILLPVCFFPVGVVHGVGGWFGGWQSDRVQRMCGV